MSRRWRNIRVVAAEAPVPVRCCGLVGDWLEAQATAAVAPPRVAGVRISSRGAPLLRSPSRTRLYAVPFSRSASTSRGAPGPKLPNTRSSLPKPRSSCHSCWRPGAELRPGWNYRRESRDCRRRRRSALLAPAAAAARVQPGRRMRLGGSGLLQAAGAGWPVRTLRGEWDARGAVTRGRADARIRYSLETRSEPRSHDRCILTGAGIVHPPVPIARAPSPTQSASVY